MLPINKNIKIVPSREVDSSFSETAGQIKAKFYVEPPCVVGTKVCSQHLGHITKIAAMPIYGIKNLQKSSPKPEDRFPRNLV